MLRATFGWPSLFANRPTSFGKDVFGRIRRNLAALQRSDSTFDFLRPGNLDSRKWWIQGFEHRFSERRAIFGAQCAGLRFNLLQIGFHESPTASEFIEKALPRVAREGKRVTASTPPAAPSLRHRTQQPSSPSHRASA